MAGQDLDEFGEIDRLFRPLTGGAPEALDLLDDAAVLRPPPGEELVVTTDALVEGVHWLPGTPPEIVARRLLRTNLSDLAAKAAEPWLWWLTVAWPSSWDAVARSAFAAGLREDQALYGLRLAGGDTVRTPGPALVSATLVGRAPEGATVRRSGARVGDVLLVSGVIGDAGLGLERLRAGAPVHDALVARHLLPEPRLALRAALRAHAAAAADVSDGLLADAGRIARASGLAVEVELADVSLSHDAAAWLAGQGDPAAARLRLATGGDDYELVIAVRPERAEALAADAARAGTPLAVVGRFREGEGVHVTLDGRALSPPDLGWRHR